MASESQVPIMTQSDSVLQFGNNAYGKPATALNILRETVMGRDLFDFAFKTYSQRWKFKRPTPSDFFRSMEDASGTDLDWFFRGWFYTTDNVDMSIENVRLYQMDTKNPVTEKGLLQKNADGQPKTLSQQRNETMPKRIDEYPSLRDLYNDFNQYEVTEKDRQSYQAFLSTLTDKEKQLLNSNYYFYIVDVKNVGGLVMPLIFKVEYMDGTSEEIRVPAEIWRYNNFDVSKMIVTKKEAKAIVLDPNLEIADTNLSNNFFPRRAIPTRFQIFKQGGQVVRPQTTTGATAANITGKWNVVVQAPGQNFPFTLNLAQQGNVITGTVEGSGSASQITTGSMENGTFTIDTNVTIGGQTLPITIKGQFAGNQMSGTVTAPQGTADFTGTRAN